MARRRIFLVFVLAISAGGALAMGTYNYVQQLPAAQASAIPTQPVVVAAADLQIGAELRREDVRIIDWPASAAPQGVFTTLDEVIGRGLVISANAGNPFSRLLAGSITMIFFTYAFVNMGMVTGILPVVGVPLPMMSYGGTAMVTLGLGAGALMAIARHTQATRPRRQPISGDGRRFSSER